MSDLHQTPQLMVAYDIPLRRDLIVRLVLPADMTEAEAARLCSIVRTLGFPAPTLAEAEARDRFLAEREVTREAGHG